MTTRHRLTMLLAATACGGSDTAEHAPGGHDLVASVEITAPAQNAIVPPGAIQLAMTVQNIALRPAGTQEPNTGHHHLFVNHPVVAEGEVIPAESGIVHLGAAQTTYTFEGLAPGSYTVIAVIGDHAHVRIPGARTDTVRFTVGSN